MSKQKKAYSVSEDNSGIYYIVFAETASKAKYELWLVHDDICTDYSYFDFFEFACGFSVKRLPEADKEYRGHSVMDWHDSEDRMFLVKELDWSCNEEEIAECECNKCVAFQFCNRKEEWEEEVMDSPRDFYLEASK